MDYWLLSLRAVLDLGGAMISHAQRMGTSIVTEFVLWRVHADLSGREALTLATEATGQGRAGLRAYSVFWTRALRVLSNAAPRRVYGVIAHKEFLPGTHHGTAGLS